MIWLKLGGRNFHLIKLAGSFFVFAFILKALEAAYEIFVTANKALFAYKNPTVVAQFFGWSINAPVKFTSEDVLGVLLGPVANFLLWLALAVVALIVYRSGRVILPLEEFEQKISEHHKMLIAKAREAHGTRREARAPSFGSGSASRARKN
ncbi:MAG: hypothetical protein AABW54_02330 [Candidatus Micrarchaeota archaeon]